LKGIYLLISKITEPINLKIGALGEMYFEAGRYIYVGSAQRGIEKRVGRHLGENKKNHWHIDYLLEVAEIEEFFGYEGEKTEECDTASKLMDDLQPIKGFGCSDCKCESHLFYAETELDMLKEGIRDLKGKENISLKDLKAQ